MNNSSILSKVNSAFAAKVSCKQRDINIIMWFCLCLVLWSFLFLDMIALLSLSFYLLISNLQVLLLKREEWRFFHSFLTIAQSNRSSLSLVVLLDNKSTLEVKSCIFDIIKSGMADTNFLWYEQFCLHFSFKSSYRKNRTVHFSFASTANSLLVFIS